MGVPPLTVAAGERAADVIERLRRHSTDHVVVVDQAGRPAGIVTEHDFVQRLEVDVSQQIGDLMSSPVHTIAAHDYLYHAIAQMLRHRVRHMPVVDADGRPVGILHLHEAQSVAAAQLTEQIELLTHSETLGGMAQTKSAQFRVATQLLDDAVPAPEIQSLLTRINNDLYRRIVEVCVRDMRDEGYGRPPVAFDVIVMGSGGRGESYLYPDQDNGFILADYPDSAHRDIDPWFIELASRMTEALNEIGFPFCKGHVMATNPLWRKTISQWNAQISQWVGKGAGTVLRLADIVFDFIPVWGEGRFAAQLRDHVTANARRTFFLREMFKLDQEHEVALGLFNRLLTDRQTGPNQGKLNLKLTGTLPLVGAVRIAALAKGIPQTATLKRIEALRDIEFLSRDEEDYLSGAFRHITRLLLRQQLRDYNAGRDVGNHVALEEMSRRERDILVDGFQAIKTFRTRLRTELTGDLF